MRLGFTERKFIRKNFASHPEKLSVPFLLDVQMSSYRRFLQKVESAQERENIGLERVLRSVFPINSQNGNFELNYVSYRFDEPRFDIEECKARGYTYEAFLKGVLVLTSYDRKNTDVPKERIEQEVYLCDVPLMTPRATFIINGIEKSVVAQLHRSPGVYFQSDKGSTHSSGKILYSSRIIPYRGAWLDFEFDHKDCLFVRIDRRRKLPVTVLLRAWGMDDQSILSTFFDFEDVRFHSGEFGIKIVPEHLSETMLPFPLEVYSAKTGKREVLVESGQRIIGDHLKKVANTKSLFYAVPDDYLLGKILAGDIVDQKTGEVLLQLNMEITSEVLRKIKELNVNEFSILHTSEVDRGPYISKTLSIDKTERAKVEAQFEIYQVIRPGDRFAPEVARKFFEGLFESPGRYSLSAVGRFKLDTRLGRKGISSSEVLSLQDVSDVIQVMLNIRDGRDSVDDIDSLANRRVRCVGEIVENVMRVGLLRIERVVKERLTISEGHSVTPRDLINPKPIVAAMREFFYTSQLAQFTEQNNPLSEVTHTRRISALGPGGLTSERASFEVRDVHPTHYGRLCPIATPEGPNTGLINSLSLYARVNHHGFLETPYVKVEGGRQTTEIMYMTAFEEKEYVIAQANSRLDENGHLVDTVISCRKWGEFVQVSPREVDFMDVSTKQIVSVAAALIPFLEHDDANRALMGSNMQRQAVPLLRSESPLIGTGIERVLARDSGAVVVARRSGEVYAVDANRIVIHAKETRDEESSHMKSGVDIYRLSKFKHTNQNTCLNHKPLVSVGDQISVDDVIADNSATSNGELSLGQNVLVALMPWNGYNFEDSILISENLVREGYFSNLRIEEFVVVARVSKTGDEEITSDIPNVSEYQLGRLSDSGIIYIGAHVKPGDILVGKITPKGDGKQTSEEKLLHAIFGEKASDVKDASLRVPEGATGTVIDIRVFTKDGVEKDEDALQIEERETDQLKKDYNDELQVFEDDLFWRVRNLVLHKSVVGGPEGIQSGEKVTDAYLNSLDRVSWFEVRLEEEEASSKLEEIHKQFEEQREALHSHFEERISRVRSSGDLQPDVLKIVKVYVAVKSRIQPGDKLAGRHGNKGVVSMIVPVEDMPFTEDGKPVDVVLNPLGVPSRLNVGQVLETHLGWAAKGLGEQINKLLQQKVSESKIREYFQKIYSNGAERNQNIDDLSDGEIIELAENVRHGVPMNTPIFDGASESEIKDLLELAGLPRSGQVRLYDGRTGEPFDREVTIGYMYILKLNHLVEDKMHARSTGHYSMVTQQPLGGKSLFGGQRFGEMEVWALEAYGAAHILQEVLTVKSDDIKGRNMLYSNILKKINRVDAGVPESFNVLMKEIRSLCLNIDYVEDLDAGSS